MHSPPLGLEFMGGNPHLLQGIEASLFEVVEEDGVVQVSQAVQFVAADPEVGGARDHGRSLARVRRTGLDLFQGSVILSYACGDCTVAAAGKSDRRDGRLPAERAPIQATSGPEPFSDDPAEEGSTGGAVLEIEKAQGTETILLVEDDEAVRSVARRALVRFGYHVLSASRGPEALEVAASHKGTIDLLLTDIMMPGMNGVEVAAAVSRLRPGLLVFFMSGYADQDLVRQGLLEPGTHFLQKPFTPQELAERIRRILDRTPEPGRA
jgi:CheY-like chemotaxis protein